MSVNVAELIKETTSTTGTGLTLTLSQAAGFGRFSDAFPTPGTVVPYALISGNGDLEVGEGTVQAGNTFDRTTVDTTVEAGVWNGGAPGRINLTGTSTIAIAPLARIINGIYTKLDTVETGATADQTAAEILALLLGVDGAGSSLDADTVDGVQANTLLSGRRNIVINSTVPFVDNVGAATGFSNGDYIGDIIKLNRIDTTAVLDANVFDSGTDYERPRMIVTTADTTVGVDMLIAMNWFIEGLDCLHLNLGEADAATITIQFNHKHTKTGTYCVALYNSAQDRRYIFEYTQSVSDAIEHHEETITLDTTGSWLTGTAVGMQLRFVMAAGSNKHAAAANTWGAGSEASTSNQVNGADAVSNDFGIFDLQVEVGSVATEIERLPFAEKLALVQRYYEEQVATLSVGVRNSGDIGRAATTKFAVHKRATPTITYVNASNFSGTPNANATKDGVLASGSATSAGVNTTIGQIIADARF